MAVNSRPPIEEFAKQFFDMGKRMQEAQRPSVVLGSKAAQRRLDRAAVQAAGSDMKFSNLGKAKAVLSSRVKVTESGGEVVGHITASGPWGLSEYPIESHPLTPKLGRITGKGATRRRRQRDLSIAFGGRSGFYAGKKPMSIPGVGPRFKAAHPGTKGKGTWAKAIPDVERIAAKEIKRTYLKAVRFK